MAAATIDDPYTDALTAVTAEELRPVAPMAVADGNGVGVSRACSVRVCVRYRCGAVLGAVLGAVVSLQRLAKHVGAVVVAPCNELVVGSTENGFVVGGHVATTAV